MITSSFPDEHNTHFVLVSNKESTYSVVVPLGIRTSCIYVSFSLTRPVSEETAGEGTWQQRGMWLVDVVICGGRQE